MLYDQQDQQGYVMSEPMMMMTLTYFTPEKYVTQTWIFVNKCRWLMGVYIPNINILRQIVLEIWPTKALWPWPTLHLK
jgi:hypothetical protein